MNTSPLALSKTFLLTLASLTISGPVASAADYLWNGATGTWSIDPAYTPWSGQAWQDGNTAVFNNVGATTVTVIDTVRPDTIKLGGSGAGAFNINGGVIDFGENQGVLDGSTRASGAGFFTLNSSLAGTGGITISTSVYNETSTSLFTLAGDNRGLTGGITITNGFVDLSGAYALGDNVVTLNGGGLGLFNTLTVNNAIVLGENGGFFRTWGGRTLNFNGTISGGRATFGTVGTQGLFNLNVNNTVTGLTLTGLTGVQLNNGSRLNVTSGVVNLTTGNNTFIQNTSGAIGTLTSSSGTLTVTSVDASGNTTTGNLGTNAHNITVIIADADEATPLKLVKNGSNQLVLSGDNTYTGGTEINAGRINVNHLNALGSGDVTVNTGGQAFLAVAGTYANNFTLAGNGVTESAGTLGALRIQGTAATPTIIAGNVALAANARITTYGANDVGVISGNLQGAFNLEKTGSGRLILGGDNTGFTGTLTVAAGTLQIGNGETTGHLANASLVNNATLAFNRSDTWAFANTISGAGAVRHDGTGVLTLTGINTYTGVTTLAAGVVSIANLGNTTDGGNLGTGGQINLHGGTLRYTGDSVTTTRIFNTNGGVNGGTLEITGADTVFTLNAALNSDGGRALTKTGAGILVLAGSADNYRSSLIVNDGTVVFAKTSDTPHSVGTALTINGGTVRLDGAGNDQIYVNAPVTMTGGTFDLNGKSEAFGILNGTGGIVTNTATGTTSTLTLGQSNFSNTGFAGILQDGAGTLAVAKIDTGTLILTGNNSYSGATTVSAGTLQIGDGGTSGSLGNTAVSLANNTTLLVDRAGTLTQGGVISGTGTGKLVKNGTGTFVLNKANTFTGGTTINAGTVLLDFSADGAPAANILLATSALTLASGELAVKGAGSSNGVLQTFASTTLQGDATVRIDKGDASRVDVNLGTLTLNGFSLNLVGGDTTLSGGLAVAGTANFRTTTVAGANNGSTRLGNTLWNGAAWTSTASDGDATYLVQWQGTYIDVSAKNDTLANNATGDMRILDGTGGTGSVALVLGAATTTVNSLLVATTSDASSVSLAGTNNALVVVTGDIALGTGAQSFTLGTTASEGTLTTGAAVNTAGRIRINNASASALTVNAVIKNNGTGAVGLDVGGTGISVLGGANTYTGSTTVGENAALHIAGTGSLGNGTYAGAFTSEGTVRYSSSAAQRLNGATGISGSLILDNDNLTFGGATAAVTQTVNAAVSGTGTLNKTGAGSLYLGGGESNTNAGGLVIDNTGASRSASGTFIYFGKTNGATVNAADTNVVFTGTGTHQIVMLGDNQFAAGTILDYQVANGNYSWTALRGTTQTVAGIQTGTTTALGGGVIDNGTSVIDTAVDDATLIVNGSGYYVFNGHFRDTYQTTATTGKLNLIKDGTGTQVLAGTRLIYSGTTDVRGGVLEFANVGSGSTLASATTVRDGALLKFTGALGVVINNDITLDGGTAQFSTTSAASLQTGALNGTGTVTKDGTGNLVFQLAAVSLDKNSLIDVQTGTAANNNLVTNWSNNQAELRLAAGTTFDLRGVRTTVGALNGSGAIVNSASGGSEGILGNVLTVGSGGGSGTYTGNITAGAWNSTGNAALGTARFRVDLHKVGAGTQIFAGSHEGAVITIDGGTFQLGDGVSLNGSTEAATIVNNATFKVANAVVQTLSSSVSGTGNFVKSGAGVLTLNGKNTYTGGTTIENGTLRLSGTSLSSGTTIMPFGDSITLGSGGTNGSYRGFLYSLLNASGNNFTFVGEQTGMPGSLPSNQQNHAGISGDYMVYQIAGGSRNAIFNARIAMQPDAVLLHFGINDIQGGGVTDQNVLRTRLTTLIDTFIEGSPDTTIFLAKIVPATNKAWNTETLAGFHATMEDVVSTRQAEGKKIVLVDLNTDFPANALPDNLHPNDTGYAWMARQWYNALMENLGEDVTQALPTGTNVTIGASGTLDVNNRIATIGTLGGTGQVTLGSGTLILNSAENASFGGVISGTGTLIKSGAGTQTLTGDNLFTGGTLVEAGRLAVNGSLTSGVEVWDGGTLGGTGVITGDILVLEGGVLSPGNSIGTLNLEGNIVLADGAQLLIEITDGGVHDILAFLGVGNTVTFEEGAQLLIVNTGDTDNLAGDYQIFQGDVTLDGLLQFSDSNYIYTFNSTGGLNISAIPEPSTYALVGLVGAGTVLFALRRRRVRP